ncbi:MAG: hypothetical protein JXA66_01135 [Oligoflexia bacterium]|nr:hypothetical protein [Oligoflexia bacterium]
MDQILLIPTQFEASFIKTPGCVIPGGNIHVSGIGKKTASTLLKIIENKRTLTDILLAGFAGSLAEKFKIGDTFIVDKVYYKGNCISIPEPSPPANIAKASLFTVKKPVFDEKTRTTLSVFADLVDMESYHVAKICAEKNLRLSVIRTVSDQCRKSIIKYFRDPNQDLPPEIKQAGKNLAETVKIIWQLLCAYKQY